MSEGPIVFVNVSQWCIRAASLPRSGFEMGQSSNLISNCGFESQHILGVPDNWLLTMVEVADPYVGGADPWASLNTDAAYARTDWFSLRYTSSKPHTSRLQNSNMLNIRANATYTLELWTSSPTRTGPVSLLVVSTTSFNLSRRLMEATIIW